MPPRIVRPPFVALALAIGSLGIFSNVARASGFQIYEQSARAIGKGSAVSASVADPSANWYNPAALVGLPQAGVQASAGLIFGRSRFSPASGDPDTRTEPGRTAIPSLFAHARLSDRLHAGIGFGLPVALAVTWPDGWVGAEQSLKTSLRIFAGNANLAFRITDKVAIAAGLSLLRGTVDFTTGQTGRTTLSGSAWGTAGNVAVLYRPLPERVHLAATYRSRSYRIEDGLSAGLVLKGRADFSPPPELVDAFPDQNVRAIVTLPAFVTVGVMARPVPPLELTLDLQRTFWSAFQRLTIDFEQPQTPDRTIERTRVDPFTVRAGAEWNLAPRPFRVRTGVFFVQSATRKENRVPAAPDAHRLGLSAGMSYATKRFDFDLGYLFAYFFDAKAEGPAARPEGTYRTRAHVLAIGIAYRFSRP